MIQSKLFLNICDVIYIKSDFSLEHCNSARRYIIRKQMGEIALGLNLPIKIKVTMKNVNKTKSEFLLL